MEVSDWNQYYQSKKYEVPQFIVRTLFDHYMAVINEHIGADRPLVIAELGGANSCFYERFERCLKIAEYHIVDNNKFGLELSRQKNQERVHLHDVDLLSGAANPLGVQADLVFSAGLIEHFDVADTRACIHSHFDFARPGGLVMMSFPTPTWVYWSFRRLLEVTGQFPPLFERPLRRTEVASAIEEVGSLLEGKTIWKTALTQLLVLGRKSSER